MNAQADTQHNTQSLKVLLLQNSEGKEATTNLAAQVPPSCNITIVRNLEEALTQVKQHNVQAVLLEPDLFLKYTDNDISRRAASILDTIEEGVCVVSVEGKLLYANRAMLNLPEALKQEVAQRGKECCACFKQKKKSAKHSSISAREKASLVGGSCLDNSCRVRRYCFALSDQERYFDIVITPICDPCQNIMRATVVVQDATEQRRLQQRITSIDKAGSELIRLDASAMEDMNTEQRIELIQNKIIRYARELLHFDHFIIRLLNNRTGKLEVLFGTGLPHDEGMELSAQLEGNGITGYVAASGRSYLCNHPEQDPRYIPGRDGTHSCLTVPLMLHDKVIGTMNVESEKEAAFTEEDLRVAEIFGRYIAIAMNTLELLVVERYQSTGQTTAILSQQISEPVSRIIAEVSSLLHENNSANKQIEKPLQTIMKYASAIKTALKDISAGTKGIFDSHINKPIDQEQELADKQILVVDDEEFIRETVSDVLQRYGCNVDTARNGKEAIALLAQKDYHLVLSDIKLPFATGYEIFAAARKTNKNVAVILMTGFGYDPDHSIVRANKEGLSAVLYKPFKVDDLMGEIRQALGIETK